MSEYVKPALAVILPNIGGIAGGLITRKQVKTWFAELKKPWWRPPNWLFGPVWTGLYCSMGYASYMVYRDGGGFSGPAAAPLAWFGGQLALNWAWTPLFFHFHNLKWASIEIAALWGSIVATMYSFSTVNTTAAAMLTPYLAWVSFASLLTFKIWQDNPQDPLDKQD